MEKSDRKIAIEKITEMPKEQVAKVLIFMAGMEEEHIIGKEDEVEQIQKHLEQTA